MLRIRKTVNLKEQKFFKTRISNDRNRFETTFYVVIYFQNLKLANLCPNVLKHKGGKVENALQGNVAIDL